MVAIDYANSVETAESIPAIHADEAYSLLTTSLDRLVALSGKAHRVHTAVAVAPSATARRVLAALSSSSVRFAPLPAAAIAGYVASGEPFCKAGAYAIQSAWAGRLAHIAGSYTGIMGLPLFETAELLRQLRIAC